MAKPSISMIWDKVVRFIAGHEGFVSTAYLCPAGVLTIGYGHTSAAGAPAVTRGMKITKAEALTILRRDLAKFHARADRALVGHDEGHVEGGGTSFDFNTGRIHNATWVKRFIANDNRGAEASLLTWNKGGGKVLRGLVRRRQEEAGVIFRDVWPADVSGVITTVDDIVDKSESVDLKEVESYQDALRKLGYYKDNVDGIAGPKTKEAVKSFQRDNPPMLVDGIVGPATRATLSRRLSEKQADAGTGAGAGVGGATGVGTDVAMGAADWTTLLWGIGGALIFALVIYVTFSIIRNRGAIFKAGPLGGRVPT